MARAGDGSRPSAAPRFIAFCGERRAVQAELLSLVPTSEKSERLNRVVDCGELVIYASPETRFARFGSGPFVAFGDRTWRITELADLRALCDRPPDGDYVAFAGAGSEILAIRGPSGGVALHELELAGLRAFVSHVDLGCQLAAVRGGRAKSRDVEPGECRRISTSP